MTRWEYNYFAVDEDDRDLIAMLDSHGREGWEAYAVTKAEVPRPGYGNGCKIELTFHMRRAMPTGSVAKDEP